MTNLDDVTVAGCRNCDVRPAVVAGLCAECAETAFLEMETDLVMTNATVERLQIMLARAGVAMAEMRKIRDDAQREIERKGSEQDKDRLSWLNARLTIYGAAAGMLEVAFEDMYPTDLMALRTDYAALVNAIGEVCATALPTAPYDPAQSVRMVQNLGAELVTALDKLARVEAVLADLYSHVTGMYETQHEWSDNWDDELSDIHATERWANALRAALGDESEATE